MCRVVNIKTQRGRLKKRPRCCSVIVLSFVGQVGSHCGGDDAAATGNHTCGERSLVAGILFVGFQAVVGIDDDEHIAQVGRVGDGKGAGFLAVVERDEGFAARGSCSNRCSIGGRCE